MLFYLVAYTFMIAGTFAVISVIGRTGDGAPPAVGLPGPVGVPTRCWPSC